MFLGYRFKSVLICFLLISFFSVFAESKDYSKCLVSVGIKHNSNELIFTMSGGPGGVHLCNMISEPMCKVYFSQLQSALLARVKIYIGLVDSGTSGCRGFDNWSQTPKECELRYLYTTSEKCP